VCVAARKIKMSLESFSTDLAATPFSLYLQSTDWIIPTVQTIHILSIAVVISAVLMVHLHTLDIVMRTQPDAAIAKRFIPWLWVALVVLLLTGSLLVTAEPGRSLTNSVFQLKMALVIAASVLTLLYQQPLRANPDFWRKNGGRRLSAISISVVSLAVWVCIVFAGRWIAYNIGV
jgi:hypothetical protein